MSSPEQEFLNDVDGVAGDVLNGADQDSAEQEVDIPETDFSTFSKSDFSKFLKELSQEPNVRRADKQLRDLKPALDDLREQVREIALNRFIAEGGKAEDFSIRKDDDDLIIDGAIKLLREKSVKFNREQEENKKANLNKKTELLSRLRAVVEHENASVGFQEFKKLQNEWRAAGAVPQAYNKELWASYHALVDRFFDNRSIYLELLELDRKKNLSVKNELCVRAEKLSELKEGVALSAVLRELNELHNEWKHVGPVPREEKEALWTRFKSASDNIYKKRDERLRESNLRLKGNLETKKELLARIESLKDFNSTSVKEWNEKTKEIGELQKLWLAAGPVERSKSKGINKPFWSLIKSFFSRKGQFFKTLDSARQENLNRKKSLIDRVIALKSLEDPAAAIDEVKEIQKEWKTIGPVPDRVSNKLFGEFKTACDYFFEQRRNSYEAADKALDENLRIKNQIILEVGVLSGEENFNRVKELSAQFHSTGFVPKEQIQTIRDNFRLAVDKFILTLPETDQKRDKAMLELEMAAASSDPNASRRIQQQEQMIRKKLGAAENELALLKNNVEFFARSKNADSVREEFRIRIESAQNEVDSLKSRLRLIRSMS
jgi:hypothetical protein